MEAQSRDTLAVSFKVVFLFSFEDCRTLPGAMDVHATLVLHARTIGALRDHCLQLESDLHYFVDLVAEHHANIAHARARALAALALSGTWRLRCSTAVLHEIHTFLFADRVVWCRYPPMGVLPMDPVMPYDHGHFLAPTFVLVRPPTLLEDYERMRVRHRSLAREHAAMSVELARALRFRTNAVRLGDNLCQSLLM